MEELQERVKNKKDSMLEKVNGQGIQFYLYITDNLWHSMVI